VSLAMHANSGPLSGYRPVARTATADCPVLLHRRGPDYAITSCGHVLMSTEDTGSERALGRLASHELRGVARARILVGGLGMGYTLQALLHDLPECARVVVAELLGPVVEWNRGRLGHLSGHALDDPRVRVHVGDVTELLRRRAAWDAIVLDVDNGPEWIVQRRNQALYGRKGLLGIVSALRPGGFLALWSVRRHLPFERTLAERGLRARRFRRVTADGLYEPIIYLARNRPAGAS
jgi:spermidine synthase